MKGDVTVANLDFFCNYNKKYNYNFRQIRPRMLTL